MQNGCPVEQVQKTLTHKNIATTLMYDQRTYQDKDSASYKVEY
ncbi:MAG: hypothetical protein HRU40_00035 [Saprospiraceae bacterium]|nr:hypothetical protein [Saprospiraceae bacterium]